VKYISAGRRNEQLSVGYGHWKAWVSCASDWGTRSVEPCAGERRRDIMTQNRGKPLMMKRAPGLSEDIGPRVESVSALRC
jgi:hypothetical protein